MAAECGTITVAVDPSSPDGQTLELFVARIRAIRNRDRGIAFTAIAGGPGQASTDFYADFNFAFRDVLRQRDIILVDQRGTGRSNALDCEFEAVTGLDFSPALAASQAQECLDTLPADPRFYTTSVAVADLDAVRSALGYRALDLYGVSYGTRVAQHYLRRYPQHTRSVTLDGVIATGQVVGPDIAVDAQAALDAIFERCDTEPDCRQRFGDTAKDFAALREYLNQTSVEVIMPDPLSGERTSMQLDYFSFAGAVRLLSYSPTTAALLPLMLNEALHQQNWQPLAAQARMSLVRISGSLSAGMHNAIICTEDVPYFSISQKQRAQLQDAYLGEVMVDSLTAICEVWPAGLIDDDFHQPLVSDKPVLLLSGSADPVTPPDYADQAAQGLSNSTHLVVPGHGHGVISVSCIPEVLGRFISDADPTALDVSCVADKRPTPFFVNFNGPPP